MAVPVRKTNVLLTVITVLLCGFPSAFSCHNSRLQYTVKRPYNRPRITRRGKCTKLDFNTLPPQCKGFNTNNMAYFPNILRHKNHVNATEEFVNLWGWKQAECSSNLDRFLCGIMFPQCSRPNRKKPRMVLPCRSLCEAVRDRCAADIAKNLGYTWPPPFKCDLFPTDGGCLQPVEEVEGTTTTAPEPFDLDSTVAPRIVEIDTSTLNYITEDEKEEAGGSDDDIVIQECKSRTRQAKPEGVDPSEKSESDREGATECAKGHYNCRHSSVKSYMNGLPYCCFYQKQIAHTAVWSPDSGRLESSCTCSYASPKPSDDC